MRYLPYVCNGGAMATTERLSDVDAGPGLDDVDVYAEFEKAATGTSGVDCHVALGALRERGPVFDGDAIVEVLGAKVSLSGFSGRRVFTILSWDDCMATLRNRENFSSSIIGESYGASFGKTMFELDDPEHHRLRSVVQRSFTPRGIEVWDEKIVVPVVERILTELAERERSDLAKDFTLEFPARIIFEMCRLSEDEYHQFARAAVALLLVRTHPTVARDASARLASMLGATLAARRKDPLDDDLVTVLAQASDDGGTISNEEAISFLRILLPAGAETTTHSLASLLWFMLHDHDLLERMRSDRRLVPDAVEEVLRVEPAVPFAHRLVVNDVTIGGVDIPAGSALQLALGSANRDSTRWDDPDRFDIYRPKQAHLAFGIGSHACIGASLARREMIAGINRLLDHFPDLRLDPDAVRTEITGVNFRGPTAVPALLH
jgi:cytochrome P450